MDQEIAAETAEETSASTPRKRAPRKRKTAAERATESESNSSTVQEEAQAQSTELPAAESSTGEGVEQLQELFTAAQENSEHEEPIEPPSTHGVVLAPGYWQGFEGRHGRINVFGWLSVFFAFTFFPLAFVFGFLGLYNAKAVPQDILGRVASWIGLVMSAVAAFMLIVWLMLMPLSLFFQAANSHVMMY